MKGEGVSLVPVVRCVMREREADLKVAESLFVAMGGQGQEVWPTGVGVAHHSQWNTDGFLHAGFHGNLSPGALVGWSHTCDSIKLIIIDKGTI